MSGFEKEEGICALQLFAWGIDPEMKQAQYHWNFSTQIRVAPLSMSLSISADSVTQRLPPRTAISRKYREGLDSSISFLPVNERHSDAHGREPAHLDLGIGCSSQHGVPRRVELLQVYKYTHMHAHIE